ncbi:protein phosphatase 1 regulatory subunit 37-like [Heptranchias perlo]|uniref:protein phosphatase 1 regulatory subunit 37-like n=1 Tax=Heptranchias perlo TaxID=212740 RepID=UPI003559B004
MEVSNTPGRGGQLHQGEISTNLGGGNYYSQSNNTSGEVDYHQGEINTNLGGGNYYSQSNNTPGEVDYHQGEINTNLGGGNYYSQSNNTSGEAGYHQGEINTNLGEGNYHSQSNNTPGEAGYHQGEINTNLGEGNYYSQSNNTPGEADYHRGEIEVSNTPGRGGQLHQQEIDTNLGGGNYHNQSNNTPGEADYHQGEMGVSNTPGRGGQLHQQEIDTNLGGGNYCSQSNNTPGEADYHRGAMGVSNTPGRGSQLHQQEIDTNLGEGNYCSQGNNNPGEGDEYSPGSGDHPCQGEVEINDILPGIMVNNRSEAEEEIVHQQNGKSGRGGTGDCLLENEEAKEDPEEEQMQEGAFVSVAERGRGTEIGRNELVLEEANCVAGNIISTQELERVSKGEIQQEAGEIQQEAGKNSVGDKDVPTEKTAERGKEEEINQELQHPGVNCVDKECTMEEDCRETDTLEEKGRIQKMSEVEKVDKFTQYMSTEARLQEVKIEAVQKEEQNTSGEANSKEMSSEENCQSLELTVVQQEDKNASGETIEERGVNKEVDKKNFKTVLESESTADIQLDKECRGTESDSEGPLLTAASTDRLQRSDSTCDSCSGHSASPRIRLDLLSPLGKDNTHPLAMIPSTPDQANDSTLLSPTADGRAKHGVKRVTFPSDEDIVSGAVEPKDPWRHAQNVTVEEITAAYKMACQKLNCKPINKLLKQIQEFKELSQRLDCLDLKGEKLDYKASEALEEVFKRVQFKLVDLEATNLDEDGASALFDMIEYYESATQLNISFNKHIGTRGWQAAAHMMRKTSCLQYLDARNTPLLDHSAPFVARALRISSSLMVLHLENASLSGRPLMLLATALKMNMTLRELFLADNKLNGLQDSAQLGNLLKFNCTIQLMDLRNNHILDSGLAYICDGLKEQRQGLVTLVLWNNQLTHNGMTYMAAALPYTLSLETLNLGHNAVGNEGVHKLKDGLIANRSVLRLGLASTKLTCEGAVAVAEFIADSPRLLRLDLRENEIKTGGLMALSLALKVNHSLLRLDLDREPKKETVKSFIETQKALLTEIQNGCKRNFILAKEKEEKEQKMQQSASMPEITVTLCDNTEEPPRSQVGPKTGEASEGSGNGVTQESVPSVPDNTEELGSPGESGVRPPSVECNTQPAVQDESVRVLQPSVVATPSSEKQQQHQDPSETHCEKESVTDCDARDGNSPAAISEQGMPIATELKSTGSESPVFISSPIEIPPRNNERLVSSPGRGHKIFVVTRVESPPEDPNSQDMQWLKEALQNRKSRTSEKEAKSSSEPLPCSGLDTQTALTVPASASDDSLQSGNPSELDRWADNTGHDFETICAKDCDHVIRGTALPNGLKAELVHRLPESTLLTTGRDGKAVSCSIEHEFTSPKTEKELEELLLEASQETSRETS